MWRITLQVDQIVTKLKTISSITSATNGIYFGLPMREPSSWIYIAINIVSNITTDIYSNNARLEFNVIGSTEDITPKDLVDVVAIIDDAIVTQDDSQVLEFGTFDVMKVSWANMMWPVNIVKNKIMIKKDYIFGYIAKD